MIIKAISIKEPYASMILYEEKTIETRTWETSYRGDILLCASKKPKTKISGNAFAIAELVDCRPMLLEDEWEAACPWYCGAYSWVLKNLRVIEPFSVKGRLRLFEVEYDR